MVIALLVAAVEFGVLIFFIRGRYRLTRLPETIATPPEQWPALTIVVPARNEEATIDTGLDSMARLTYPRLQILVVNDRSTDRTGEKVLAWAAKDSRIQTLTI